MNRREFLKAAAIAGVSGASAGVRAKTWRDFEVADGQYSLQQLSAEPVLAAVSETSVAVSWAVGCLASGGVEIADNEQMRNSRFVKAGEMPLAQLSRDLLQVRLAGLKSATRYYYRTVTQEIKSSNHLLYASMEKGERHVGKVYSFVTSGAAGESRFGVLTDTHAQWDSFSFVAKRFRDMDFPVGIWAGDALNCTEDRRTAVEAFLYPNVETKDYAARTPVLFLPGNHEYAGVYARHIEEVMPCRLPEERKGEYSQLKWNFAVRQGEIALLGLDTGDGLHDDDRRLCGLGSFSPYRRLQAKWLKEVLSREDMASAPYAVAFCHIPLYNSGPNKNGCEKPLERGGASWIRECQEQWGPLLDDAGVQLVVCGHEHDVRWDEETGYRWKQVVGGGPELGYGAGYKKKDSACPTIIEGVVENGHLQVRVYDAWRGGIVSERRFNAR